MGVNVKANLEMSDKEVEVRRRALAAYMSSLEFAIGEVPPMPGCTCSACLRARQKERQNGQEEK